MKAYFNQHNYKHRYLILSIVFFIIVLMQMSYLINLRQTKLKHIKRTSMYERFLNS